MPTAYLDAHTQRFDKHCNPTAAAVLPGGIQTNDATHTGDLGNEIKLPVINFLNKLENFDGCEAFSFLFGCHQLI
jgi:hypothetical protein